MKEIKPILKANLETGAGEVHVTQEWRDLPAILKATLLQDWLLDLNMMYERAVHAARMDGQIKTEVSSGVK
jgi:hypothetical protein